MCDRQDGGGAVEIGRSWFLIFNNKRGLQMQEHPHCSARWTVSWINSSIKETCPAEAHVWAPHLPGEQSHTGLEDVAVCGCSACLGGAEKVHLSCRLEAFVEI